MTSPLTSVPLVLPRSLTRRQNASRVKQQWCRLTDSLLERKWQSCSRPIRNLRSTSSGINLPSCRPPTAFNSARNIASVLRPCAQPKACQFQAPPIIWNSSLIRLFRGPCKESRMRLTIKSPVTRRGGPWDKVRQRRRTSADGITWRRGEYAGKDGISPAFARYLDRGKKSTNLVLCSHFWAYRKTAVPTIRTDSSAVPASGLRVVQFRPARVR